MGKHIGLQLAIAVCLLLIAVCGILIVLITGISPATIPIEETPFTPFSYAYQSGQKVITETFTPQYEPYDPNIHTTNRKKKGSSGGSSRSSSPTSISSPPTITSSLNQEYSALIQPLNSIVYHDFYGSGQTQRISTQPGVQYPVRIRVPKTAVVTAATFEVRAE